MYGPIPASAGESVPVVGRRHGAYPRERGGISCQRCPMRLDMGLSPRARGNRAILQDEGHVMGLSPRARGNPDDQDAACQGPIPASAGESSESAAVRFEGPIPASAGESLRLADGPIIERNRWQRPIPASAGETRASLGPPRGHGPIPASAGETTALGIAQGGRGLSPRARGESFCNERGGNDGLDADRRSQGLSPRARGKQRLPRADPGGLSPRARGKRYATKAQRTFRGLSPRARGKRRTEW